MTYKVGDKVRIVGNYNGHRYDIGHIGVITEYESDYGLFRVGPKDGGNWCGDDDVELVTTIQVGETYTGNDYTWECMFIKGDMAWMCTDTGNSAYRWNIKTGLSIDLPPEYNIDLTPEPVRKTVEWVGYWDTEMGSLHNFNGDDPYVHNVKFTVDTLDGVPQWDTIKADVV